ncbi:MAG: restriction endonuclease subunit S, partial [Clostridia bacterium]|nr:restriction endonuclease subunit S [Clostridia bacterium]
MHRIISKNYVDLSSCILHYEKFADGTVECIEDKIPFEIPTGWVWTRLGSISSAIQYGLSNSAEQIGTQRLLRITDIQDGKVNWDTVPFTTVQDPEQYLLTKGDIVFARTGATVGKSFLIEETPYLAVYASYLIRIRLLDSILPEYIYQFFNSQCYWDQITDKSVGVGQPNCNGTSLKELLIPLPPVKEQSKIVPSSRSAIEYVASIEDQKNLLLEDISTIKSKILDLAIRGKLVPQDSNDEPASLLLERIRAEKEELIRQDKIKRDKKESVIFKGEDNSYYVRTGEQVDDIAAWELDSLPKNWELCTL